MNDLIRKRDIDYISSPIAPVLKGENVHYEYVAFRKQIEDISPVPAIPISVIDQIKAEIKQNSYPIVHGVNNHEQGMTVYGIMQVIDHHIKEYTE